MNVKSYLEEEFLNEWRRQSGRDFPSLSLSRVERAFNIPAVDRNVNNRINEAQDRIFSERYEKTVLRKLTQDYAARLYSVSNQGRVLNEEIINQAKVELKSQNCPVHPC